MDAREQTDRYHLDVYNRYPITIRRGEGVWVWDSEGNRYLDALAGIAVNSLGHCHPRVVEAVREQAGRLMHISNFYYSEPQGKLCERLARMTGLERVFLCNSGAEAIEAALKTARKYGKARGKRGPLLTLENAFHGRTLATVSMGMDRYAEGYEPLLEGFREIPLNDTDALEEAFDGDTLGIIFEPVQGSGGLRRVSGEFVARAEELCRRHGALLVVDEVQTGMGRTGELFGFGHYGVRPDLVALGKAMGGGFPVAAMAARGEAAGAMGHGDHGSTYGGNPLACAAANAALEVIETENLAEGARVKGEYLRERLAGAFSGDEPVREIRGRGLMLGVVLSSPGRGVVDRMLERGVLSNCTQGNVIRLVPPLIIREEELDRLAGALIESIREEQP